MNKCENCNLEFEQTNDNGLCEECEAWAKACAEEEALEKSMYWFSFNIK